MQRTEHGFHHHHHPSPSTVHHSTDQHAIKSKVLYHHQLLAFRQGRWHACIDNGTIASRECEVFQRGRSSGQTVGSCKEDANVRNECKEEITPQSFQQPRTPSQPANKEGETRNKSMKTERHLHTAIFTTCRMQFFSLLPTFTHKHISEQNKQQHQTNNSTNNDNILSTFTPKRSVMPNLITEYSHPHNYHCSCPKKPGDPLYNYLRIFGFNALLHLVYCYYTTHFVHTHTV